MAMSMFLLPLIFIALLLTGCGGQPGPREYEPYVYEPYAHDTMRNENNAAQEYTQPAVNETPVTALPPFTSEEVVVGEGGRWPLGGTLTLPIGASAYEPVPAVVIVHGSGPNNRDGYLLGNRPYYDVANYLSANGIAVLRYDKRTFVHGAALTNAYSGRFTVWEETIEDAILAADFLRADSRIDSERIFMLGHSLGGVLAPSIHVHGGNFAGLILWAGTPRCVFYIMIEQLEAGLIYGSATVDKFYSIATPLIEENDIEALRQFITEMILYDASDIPDEEIINTVNLYFYNQQYLRDMMPALIDSLVELSLLIPYMSTEDAQATETGMGVNVYYFQTLQNHLAENFINDLALPFLVMQGGRDFQVLANVDFALYKELLQYHENATFRLYDDLDHIFMLTTATNFTEHAIGMFTARQVYPQVLRDMVDWILSQ